MKPFEYHRTTDPAEATQAVAVEPGAAFLAGGTTLVDLMKLDVIAPTRLVDVNKLPWAAIRVEGGTLKVGALARMSDVAADPAVASGFPAIAESLLASASPQLRNMATIGGNLLQRTRCAYFRDTAWPCNKRDPGSGCPAIDGENRMHAILGTSESCIATHPSDLAVALLALDATVTVRGPGGDRSIPLAAFHRLPGTTPHVETDLAHGDLIVEVVVPASPLAAKSAYLKVRDRASYEFALVSVAAALSVEGGKVADCRIALGGVGTKPWRVPAAEAALKGRPADSASFALAAEAALAGAAPRPRNAFKVELARRAVVRLLIDLASR